MFLKGISFFVRAFRFDCLTCGQTIEIDPVTSPLFSLTSGPGYPTLIFIVGKFGGGDEGE